DRGCGCGWGNVGLRDVGGGYGGLRDCAGGGALGICLRNWLRRVHSRHHDESKAQQGKRDNQDDDALAIHGSALEATQLQRAGLEGKTVFVRSATGPPEGGT